MHTKIVIPLDFSALRLARDADGHVSFDQKAVHVVEQASGLPSGYFAGEGEDALGDLIIGWYSRHRAAGGAPDPVAEDLIAEVRLEDERGGGFSHRPGSA